MHIICVHFSTQSNWHSQDVVWFSLYVGQGVTILVGSTKLDWPKTYNRSTIRWKEILGNQYQLLLAGWGWIDLMNWKYIFVLTIFYVHFSSAQIKMGEDDILQWMSSRQSADHPPNQTKADINKLKNGFWGLGSENPKWYSKVYIQG